MAVTGRGPQLATTCVGSKTVLMLAHARQGLAHVPLSANAGFVHGSFLASSAPDWARTIVVRTLRRSGS
jgi:hypothetical protein